MHGTQDKTFPHSENIASLNISDNQAYAEVFSVVWASH